MLNMLNVTQVIPNMEWTRSVYRPDIWTYQDSGRDASIVWRPGGSWIISRVANWTIRVGRSMPADAPGQQPPQGPASWSE